MKGIPFDIYLNKQCFRLLPEKAVYWGNQKMLIVSDVHLGKSEHFRRNGIGVPDYTREDLKRLDHIIETYEATRLIILGDLFHSAKNLSFIWFEDWLKHSYLDEIILIKGNHDQIPEFSYKHGTLSFVERYSQDGFSFTHFKEQHQDPSIINFSGHIHPAINLKGKARQSLKLECYVAGINYLVLPAFGSFTGNMIIEPSSSEQIYFIGGTEVFKLP